MAMYLPLQVIDNNSPSFPVQLTERLGRDTPVRLWAIGRLDLLSVPKTALFCSKTCPGHAILKAMDQAQKWRDEGRCIISGFHSPIEKECLNILLRGVQPIIICPARGLQGMRVPKEWRRGIDTGRILILSAFDPSQHRLTAALSDERNRLVAALADEIYFVHVTPQEGSRNLPNRFPDGESQRLDSGVHKPCGTIHKKANTLTDLL
ncbi:MAG: DNA-processing protein DprA [Deltaproteobacteria bacterium]|nr:DNA-processing protein DprA [Deltaproteobacteria bacterium]